MCVRQAPPLCPRPPRGCVPPMAAEGSDTSEEQSTLDTTGQTLTPSVTPSAPRSHSAIYSSSSICSLLPILLLEFTPPHSAVLIFLRSPPASSFVFSSTICSLLILLFSPIPFVVFLCYSSCFLILQSPPPHFAVLSYTSFCALFLLLLLGSPPSVISSSSNQHPPPPPPPQVPLDVPTRIST